MNKKYNCKSKTLKNKHKGNSFYPIKYAIHCDNKIQLNKGIDILKTIGFKIFKQENYGMFHTFLKPKSNLYNINNFYIVLVVKKGGHKQTLKNNKVQGPHLGFRINTISSFYRIYKAICNKTKTIVIEKPDEFSLFFKIFCGEVLEISVKK